MAFEEIRDWGKRQLARLGDTDEQDTTNAQGAQGANAHGARGAQGAGEQAPAPANSAQENGSRQTGGKSMAYDLEAAKTIYRAGRDLKVNDKVMLSAFETGIVESGMRNLNHGDSDSLGVFQQRPSQGWGTPEQILDVNHAARSYFERAIKSDAEDKNQSTGHLAQSVQRSAYPERYDQAEGEARRLLDQTAAAVDGGRPAPPPPGPGEPQPGGREFGTWGTGVKVHSEPKLDSPVVHTLNGPTKVTVDFQQRGDLVNTEGFSNPWWAHIPQFNGFMTNIFIDHPDALLPDVPQR
ncbi:hypothetical protein G4Z16_12595 [Streptomyces bathyalis]|uniref:Uncharacterized protein n=1 Tax=Streptomyces bathyalis TaxID=2710756 RepID=A0A7T1T680_9ACTN|nr:hypothetical protein [Streptomyces bathyalis]QPP07087.1 hypothetical protein G4Z16_12595 [Streptomyces bathyalis]